MIWKLAGHGEHCRSERGSSQTFLSDFLCNFDCPGSRRDPSDTSMTLWGRGGGCPRNHSNLPASPSLSAGVKGVRHHTWLTNPGHHPDIIGFIGQPTPSVIQTQCQYRPLRFQGFSQGASDNVEQPSIVYLCSLGLRPDDLCNTPLPVNSTASRTQSRGLWR